MPLLDLKRHQKSSISSLRKEKKKKENYGKISTSTTGTILKENHRIRTAGAELFFGEKSFGN
jgi:hypothetical protein